MDKGECEYMVIGSRVGRPSPERGHASTVPASA